MAVLYPIQNPLREIVVGVLEQHSPFIRPDKEEVSRFLTDRVDMEHDTVGSLPNLDEFGVTGLAIAGVAL